MRRRDRWTARIVFAGLFAALTWIAWAFTQVGPA